MRYVNEKHVFTINICMHGENMERCKNIDKMLAYQAIKEKNKISSVGSIHLSLPSRIKNADKSYKDEFNIFLQ